MNHQRIMIYSLKAASYQDLREQWDTAYFNANYTQETHLQQWEAISGSLIQTLSRDIRVGDDFDWTSYQPAQNSICLSFNHFKSITMDLFKVLDDAMAIVGRSPFYFEITCYEAGEWEILFPDILYRDGCIYHDTPLRNTQEHPFRNLTR